MFSAMFDAAVPLLLLVALVSTAVMGARANGRVKTHTEEGDHARAAASRRSRRTAWRAAAVILVLLVVTVVLRLAGIGD